MEIDPFSWKLPGFFMIFIGKIEWRMKLNIEELSGLVA